MHAKLRRKPRSNYTERNHPYYIDELKDELSYIIDNYEENDFQEVVEMDEEGGRGYYTETPSVIIDLFSYLKEFNEKIDFGHLSYTLTKVFLQKIKEIEKELSRIKKIENAAVNKENIEKLEALFSECEPIFDRLILLEEISRKSKNLDTLIKDIEKTQKITDEKNEKSEKYFLSSVVQHNANVFNDQTTKLEFERNIWIGVIILLLGVTSWVGWYLLYYYSDELITKSTQLRNLNPKPDADSIKNMENNIYLYYGIARIIIFTVLFYAINFCVKNYRAIKHNIIINKQRYNSLSTYREFLNTADDETKKEMLKIVFNTIFSHQATNFETDPNKVEDALSSINPIFKK